MINCNKARAARNAYKQTLLGDNLVLHFHDQSGSLILNDIDKQTKFVVNWDEARAFAQWINENDRHNKPKVTEIVVYANRSGNFDARENINNIFKD